MIHPVVAEDARSMAEAGFPWERLAGGSILIAGANGYVPSYFVHALLARNDFFAANIKVIALCRNETRARARFGDYLTRPDFSLLIQDVVEPVRLADSTDFIIHAAGPAGIAVRREHPADIFTANVIGALNLLELARRKNSRGFLFISSVDVYGGVRPPDRLSEEMNGELDGLNVLSAYAAAKRAAETLCADYHAQYGVPAVVARPSQVLGPGVALDDGRLHVDFIAGILEKGEIVLKSDGSAKRSFIYATDAILGMLTVLLAGRPGEAYNVAAEQNEATVLELAQLMASLVPDREIPIRFDMAARNGAAVRSALPSVLPDAGKLRALGWRASCDLPSGLARMLRSYGIPAQRQPSRTRADFRKTL